MTDEWVQLNREYKILLAKRQSAGRLLPKDEERFRFLEERLGEYQGEVRLQITETEDAGPKKITSQDHYATEVSQQVLQQAEKYQPIKAWEKEDARLQKKAIEIQDRRAGKSTFRQKGLSSFAVELTDDLKHGEANLAEVPGEEAEAAQKIETHRNVSYAKDESDKWIKKSSGAKSNPYAVELDDHLSKHLNQVNDYSESMVPDQAAKTFKIDLPETEATPFASDQGPRRPDELPEEIQSLLHKSYELPKDHGESLGEATTHEVTDQGDPLSYDLMRQALLAESERDSPRPPPLPSSSRPAKAPAPVVGEAAVVQDLEKFWPDEKPEAPSNLPAAVNAEPPPLPAIGVSFKGKNKSLSLPSLGGEQNSEPDRPAPTPPKRTRALLDMFDDGRPPPVEENQAPEQPPERKAFSNRPAPPPDFSPSLDEAKALVRASNFTGPRRATVHFLDGASRRGVMTLVQIEDDLLRLEPPKGVAGEPEDLLAISIKAIFLMLPLGATYPEKTGHRIKVQLIDGRSLDGFSPDYDPNNKGFTLFPAEDRGNIERVIIYRDGVSQVQFIE